MILTEKNTGEMLSFPSWFLMREKGTCTRGTPTMEWLRLVGSLKLQISFVKEPCKRDYILYKRPTILRSLLILATPYQIYLRVDMMVGSLKLQVSFVKEPYKRDYILQKRPIILRSLLIVATPYHTWFFWEEYLQCLFSHDFSHEPKKDDGQEDGTGTPY